MTTDRDWRSHFVDLCYESALSTDSTSLEQALNIVSRRTGAAMSLLQVFDGESKNPEPMVMAGFDPAMMEHYLGESFAQIDPWMDIFQSIRAPWGQAVCTGVEISLEPLLDTVFFNEFWKHWGMRHTSGTFAKLSDGAILNLGMPRHEDAGTFPQSMRSDLSFVTSHLTRVVEIRRRMAALQQQVDERQHALDCLKVAVVIVDLSGKIRIANQEAEVLARRDALYSASLGYLRFANPDVQEWLRALIQAQADAAPDAVKPVRVANEAGKQWWIQPFPWPDGSQSRWALVFFDPSSSPGDVSVALATLGGLTPAEHQVLTLLLKGMSAQEIGERRSTTRETTRGQIKSVLNKLGVRRQVELMRLASTLVSPFRQSSPE